MRGELTEKMAVDLVSKFIPFILGNTGVDTSVLLGVKMSTPRQPYLPDTLTVLPELPRYFD